ncbi:serine hydrolase domain-containing protein [Paenibacillus sp. sgz500958]|uniref:serine hydrolase domain-containing protein n=1 Tax=Paenibacillus sp. sgz500958 TaxID=3242475 RepID=UPI0036D2B677
METAKTAVRLPRSYPEDQKVPGSAIAAFLEAVRTGGLELHSFMMLRHGSVIAEAWWAPYKPNLPHMLFSLSKSFTSTAVGLAVSEQLISLDDPVISFFPDELPDEISENLAAMQVRHLLMMGTGHEEDTMIAIHKRADGDWVKAFLNVPVTKQPGTHFLYNTGATYMLSAILQKRTGQTLLEYLEPRLFQPLGITGAAWESCPRGINTGGFGLSLTTEDIAKFGQLYLKKGSWNGQRIIDEEWINEATSKQIANGQNDESDWAQGYGYQFWRCRHGVYRGDGAFGQFCVVLPEQDAVIAITSGTNDLQGVLNAVWDHLLPALNAESVLSTVSSRFDLSTVITALSIEPPSHTITSPMEKLIDGKKYMLDDPDQQISSISFSFGEHGAAVLIHNTAGEQVVHAGRGEWKEDYAEILDQKMNRMMSSFTWLSNKTLELTLRFVETPYCVTVQAVFEEPSFVQIKQWMNVSFNPKVEVVTGRAE